MCSKCPFPAQTLYTLTPLTNSTFKNRVTQGGPLAVDVMFQFINVLDLGTIDSLLKHTSLHTS